MSTGEQLLINLYDQHIGHLLHLGGDRVIFSFDQRYLDHPNRPTLSLSFINQSKEVITDQRPTQTRLPPFFSNLLPEGHLREYMAANAGIKAQREFYLLWWLGQDLPGAITAVADQAFECPQNTAEAFTKNNTDNHLHFSLAGVQLKFSALLENRGGLTIPAEGIGGKWIIKLPSAQFENVPENEYSMMLLADKVGIQVPEVKLVPIENITGLPPTIGFKNQQVLAIKRFDRGIEKIHMEDFNQIYGLYPHEKYGKANYKNILATIHQACSQADTVEFIRRLVFNVLIGNADFHTKNISVFYPDKVHAKLAPAYDLVSTIAFIPDENMALNYIKTKRFSDFDTELVQQLATKVGISTHLVQNTVSETIQRFLEIWQIEQSNLPLSKEVASLINKHLSTLPLIQ